MFFKAVCVSVFNKTQLLKIKLKKYKTTVDGGVERSLAVSYVVLLVRSTNKVWTSEFSDIKLFLQLLIFKSFVLRLIR